MRPPPPPPPPSPPPVEPSLSENKWGPYSSAREFVANIAIVLIVPIAAILAFFFFFALVGFLLRRLRRHHKLLKNPAVDVPPAILFSPATKMAGADAGCGICLSEFTDGDRVRVLPACAHGFHVTCVDAWLASRPSCPTCCAAIVAAAAAANPPEP
ncbi:hypothetical protein J5N97_025522 [Dioscorea zingiberensis]|uniref:RING-type domain-containing protein n=1 Tax=Dioscorea zingiberensis TaxID=325984 RepID=A0A9D5C9Z1_9LILI|nr:hypothetical protein J5N97_025522 [Dioscorea zingiberensis]